MNQVFGFEVQSFSFPKHTICKNLIMVIIDKISHTTLMYIAGFKKLQTWVAKDMAKRV